ncbi:MAG: hypothetical protein ABL962_06250 [Fimbriimonadaceae bacterium]
MRYYVIATDGQRYGPADIQTLQTWITQGRILHQTVLEEEQGGNRIAACAVGALQFGAPNPAGNPPTQPSQTPLNPYSGSYQPPTNQQSNPYQQNPYAGGSNYYRPGQQPVPLDLNPNAFEAQRCMTNSWICFAIAAATIGSFCCCSPVALVGVVLSIVGIIQALKAKSLGNSQGQTAFVCNAVALVLCIGTLLLTAAMMFIN